jgi:hypothetical protein
MRANLAGLVLLVVGCSDQSFVTVQKGGDGEGPGIEVSPKLLNFGVVSRGEEAAVRSFVVSSVGATNLTVDGLQIDGEAAGSFSVLSDTVPTVLPPGAEVTVDVAFVPLGANDQIATLSVFSDDPDQAIEQVELFGGGAVPELQISPDPLDFGASYVGCPKTMPVELSNVGTDTLEIGSIAWSGDPEISMGATASMPVSLEPGEALTVDFAFNPSSNVPAEGLLQVDSNEPLGSRTATQVGLGRFAGDFEELWEIPADPPTDILFAVDQSCSMDDDTARLASNFSTFISLLGGYSTDWQVIVANGDDGCNQGGILAPTVASYNTTFSREVGQNGGSYTEALLSVAANAIEKSAAGYCNYGFVREDAALHLILVSDEPEQSAWLSGQTWDVLVGRIQAAKGDAGRVKISAIAGDYPSGCSSADAGTGYYEAVTSTGGEFLSICSDWASAVNLERLASASITQTSFTLERTPLVSSIEVRLNGVVVSGWAYDAATNTITMPDGTRPEEGDVVQITYGGVASCD